VGVGGMVGSSMVVHERVAGSWMVGFVVYLTSPKAVEYVFDNAPKHATRCTCLGI